MLKNEYWNVFIKYKDFNTNHSHPDKLNIEIKLNNNFLTHDLSTSGYGSNICKDFYKKTYSHNTIVIDGENQNLECNSIVNLSTENVISIASDDIYRESKITREIKLDNDKMFDKITVKCSETRTIDYFFHSDAKITNKIDGIDVKKIVEYPYLKDIKKVNCELGNVLIEWDLNGIKLATEINLDAQEIYLCKSPDNPNSKGRTTLLIRTKGTEMNVDTQFYLS